MQTEQTEKAIWLQRYQALDRVSDIVQKRINTQGLVRSRTMDILLSQLRAFGKKQFDFFFYDRNFQPDDNTYHHALAPLDTIEDDAFAPYKLSYSIHDYALRVTLNQIATDIAELQRRQEEQAKADNNQDGSIGTALQLADWLALQALKPFRETITDSRFTALTIIQKNSFARIFPYAPVALIGIPYSAIAVDLDFLTIPHEVAHFIYWHGKAADGQYLRKKLKDAMGNSPIAAWHEEIFADVIGLLIGGPIMAAKMQQMVKEVVAEPFDSDDGIHPIPRIRPYIHLDLLERLGGSENDHYKKLADSWASVEANRPLRDNLLSLLRRSETSRLQLLRHGKLRALNQFAPQQLRDEISQSITQILAFFPDWEQMANSAWTSLTDPQPLTEQFYAYIARQRTEVLPDIDDAEFTIINNPEQWQQAYSWEALATTNYNLELYKTAGLLQVIEPETWIQLLAFDGWTTEGPGPGHVTPE